MQKNRKTRKKEAEDRWRLAQTRKTAWEERTNRDRKKTLLREFAIAADQTLSDIEVIRYRDQMLDYRHEMMSAPAPRIDPHQKPDKPGSTIQTLRDQYHTFLISVCTRAGFVPENSGDQENPDQNRDSSQNTDREKNHDPTNNPANDKLLREVIEEYIFERAFQAESPEDGEEDEPERTGHICRDSCETGDEKNSTEENRGATTRLPQNRYPAITSPENAGRNLYSQEQA